MSLCARARHLRARARARYSQPSGTHGAPATVRPTELSQLTSWPQVPGFCARRRAVATAPGLVDEAMTGFMKSMRFELPAPQNVASRLSSARLKIWLGAWGSAG